MGGFSVLEKQSMKTLGEHIRHFRKKRKLTQSELAEKIGVFGKVTIYQYEKNLRVPDHKTMLLIAEALDCVFIQELRDKNGI